MSIMKAKDRDHVRKLFEKITHDVRLVFFTQETECELCSLTRELVTELAALSPHLKLEVHDFVADADLAKSYGIDKIPALALLGDEDYGIRFFGIPSGYEFVSLIEGIVDVGRRDPGLPPAILEELAKVDRPVHLQAMVTPTCPYCPRAVRTAHRFAMASKHIRGDMVEISEFPHLAVKYRVQGVPNTIINEDHSIVGGQPEAAFVQAILKAIGK